MTEQTNNGKAYNITVTPISDVDSTPNAKGTPKLKFRAKVTLRGRETERTVVAQGAAVAKIDGKIVAGEPVALRVLFSNAPANDEGKGGEFLTVVDLPRAKAA